jgi:hypothetical protein
VNRTREREDKTGSKGGTPTAGAARARFVASVARCPVLGLGVCCLSSAGDALLKYRSNGGAGHVFCNEKINSLVIYFICKKEQKNNYEVAIADSKRSSIIV